MKTHDFLSVAGLASVVLLSGINARAGDLAYVAITNLPSFADAGAQVNDLSSNGQITGFFYLPEGGTHAFLYNAGAVTDLGTLGGYSSYAMAINGSGQVIGDSDTVDGQTHAFIYSGGELTDLKTLGGSTSSALAMNDAGQVVGTSSFAGDATSAAFLYSGGSMASLSADYVYPYAINNSNVVVGVSPRASGDHAFLFSDGTMSDLGTLGGTYSTANAVNDQGVVAGQAMLANGQYHGFVYTNGVMTDMGTVGGTYSFASAVNRDGQVLGVSTTAGDMEYHACLYEAGKLTDLGTLGGTYSWGYALNNLGQVAGESLTASGALHAFLWQSGKMVDLNDVLPPGSGWELNGAQFINDAGRVVGYGTLNGISQFFVLDVSTAGDNKPPVPVIAPVQTVECPSAVTLDASASTDPDGDAITFAWSMAGTVLGTNPTLTTSLPLGATVITLKVTDVSGASTETNVTVTVVDTTPPAGSCPAPITVSSDEHCQAVVPDLVSQVAASDTCTPANLLQISQDLAAGTIVGPGEYPITITVVDQSGNKASCVVAFTVKDTTAPVIQALSANPNTLYPPNHQLVPVTVSAVVTDQCDSAPWIRIVSVTCSDPTAPGDIQVTGNLTVNLAASKGASGGVRVYTITVAATDAAQNTSTAAVTVSVTKAPTSNGKNVAAASKTLKSSVAKAVAKK